MCRSAWGSVPVTCSPPQGHLSHPSLFSPSMSDTFPSSLPRGIHTSHARPLLATASEQACMPTDHREAAVCHFHCWHARGAGVGRFPRGGTRLPANQPQLALGMHGPSRTQVLLSLSSLAVRTTNWAATEWEALGQTLQLSYTGLPGESQHEAVSDAAAP